MSFVTRELIVVVSVRACTEHSNLNSAYWDKRARGCRATTAVPGAEENVLL